MPSDDDCFLYFYPRIRPKTPLLLQNLPLLMIKEVLKCMNAETLFYLSCCSRKTRRILKSCIGKNHEISIYLACETHVTFASKVNQEFKRDEFEICLENLVFGAEKHTHFEQKEPNQRLQLRDPRRPVDGILSFIHHFLDSFNSLIDLLFIENWCLQDETLRILQSIISRQSEFEFMILLGKVVKNEDLKFLIQNSTVSKYVKLNFSTVSPLDFHLELSPKELHIDGDWCTVDNLLSMEFELCEFVTSQFTIEDWKTLLKAWRNGWNPQMKHLTVAKSIEFESIIDEFAFGSKNDATREVDYKMYYIHYTYEIDEGYDIQRISGDTVATVYPKYYDAVFHGEKSYDAFDFHVWH